jgi:hypothetical protein
MHRTLTSAVIAAAAVSLTGALAAQNCYDSKHQCFTFGPPTGSEVGKVDTGGALDLRSQKLSIEGDIRLRVRSAETRMGHPYAAADQQATRARIRMRYQATEKVEALAEFNFSETWAGSQSYSDALVGEDFNGVSQFYLDADDMFGFGDRWRVGRSEFILSNGLVLGSCDFLQRPGTFTGVWFSHQIAGHDFELFAFDDYGPLQAVHPGTRYAGGTANIVAGELCGDLLQAVKPYYMAGTGDGDLASEDAWLGVDAVGLLPGEVQWNVEYSHRIVAGGMDRTAWRGTVTRRLDWFDRVFESVSLQITDANGKMDVGNPADFNSAGLLHQYGGAWRSDLQTGQLGMRFVPLEDVSLDLNLLTLDRRGASPQLGDFEADVVLGAKFASGVYASGGYGIDNDRRQVGYIQLTMNF